MLKGVWRVETYEHLDDFDGVSASTKRYWDVIKTDWATLFPCPPDQVTPLRSSSWRPHFCHIIFCSSTYPTVTINRHHNSNKEQIDLESTSYILTMYWVCYRKYRLVAHSLKTAPASFLFLLYLLRLKSKSSIDQNYYIYNKCIWRIHVTSNPPHGADLTKQMNTLTISTA